jgi:hypothetical protein
MPLYHWNYSPQLPYAKIWDATGERISHVVWCDTETGEMERIIYSVGSIEETITETRLAPLRVEFLKR